PRQVLDLSPQAAEERNRRVERVETGVAQIALERLFGIDELEVVHHLREPVDEIRLDRQRLAHLARGAPAAIRDDVRRHRGTPLPTLPMDVLVDAPGPTPVREIEIDVGPFAALL